MEIKINKLNKIKEVVKEVIDSRLEILDRASTSEEYYTLESTRKNILNAFENSVMFDRDKLDKHFSNHPFKTMFRNWGNTTGVNINYYLNDDQFAFNTRINNYNYDFKYNYKSKEFNFPKTGRKNNNEIQEYFRRKISAIDIELIEYL